MPDSDTQKARSYKSTLNLPKTAFPMKGNLVQNEPASLKRWQKEDLYKKIRQSPHPAGPYVFHDGPPYANGSIHLGHLLNKVLKDLVVRSKTMAGFDCPYTPGWDCHGLPIEHKVMQDLGDKAKGMAPFQIRRKCQASAEKFVKLQSGQMQRLLTLADYKDPYLTMTPDYEAAVLEVFADLVGKGLVYRALKPVHWSIENQTALAEAELEYENREDPSIYVLFEVEDKETLLSRFKGRDKVSSDEPVHLMIWTTTPWTLPANLAVAVHPDFEYGLYGMKLDGQEGKTTWAIVASKRSEDVLPFRCGLPPLVEFCGYCSGRDLEGVRYHHPFLKDDRSRRVVLADYVTLEDGTGLVHTAPGHGTEDYQTGLREKLEVYCPVQADGTFDNTAPDWLRGVNVWKANDLVVEHLRKSNRLYYQRTIEHSYPNDWRSKKRIIYRATDQWFIGVEKPCVLQNDPEGLGPKGLRERALREVGFDWRNPISQKQKARVEESERIDQEARREAMEAEERGEDPFSNVPEEEAQELNKKYGPLLKWLSRDTVTFFPGWGRNRMRGMLESRPDWCISRQRSWGLPIPAFLHPKGALLTAASVRAVAANIAKHGSDFWFKAEPVELLEGYDSASDPDVPGWFYTQGLEPDYSKLQKAHDIFDVWFESGSSWNAVLKARKQGYPADLYLEGSDQHRGWFQLSLLPALGVTGESPFKAVLTHGFMVDKDGRKMSKSGGNALEVDTLLKDFGADVCRWWVGSLNPDNDIKVDHEFFRIAGEEYRKVRNTLRFLLSNLNGFDPAQHRYAWADTDATSIDAWAMGELNRLIGSIKEGYEQFHFRRVHEAVFGFCNQTMSAVYLGAVKDRLYCDPPDSPRRRRTQTVIHDITDALIRLVAPILPHTADEAWHVLHGRDAPCVHLSLFPDAQSVFVDEDWGRVMDLRSSGLKAIEIARAGSDIDNPLDCGLRITLGRGEGTGGSYLSKFDPTDLADLYGISRVEIAAAPALGGVGDSGAGASGGGAGGFEVLDLRDQPRCERCWKRDGTVKQRSDGGLLSDRDARALGLG